MAAVLLMVADDTKGQVREDVYGNTVSLPGLFETTEAPCVAARADSLVPACLGQVAEEVKGIAGRYLGPPISLKQLSVEVASEAAPARITQYTEVIETPELDAQAAAIVAAPIPVAKDAWYTEMLSACAHYGCSADDMYAVMLCESGGDPNAQGSFIPGAPEGYQQALGLMQFMPGTWAGTPYASSSIYDGTASIWAAAWMWQQGRRGEWTC